MRNILKLTVSCFVLWGMSAHADSLLDYLPDPVNEFGGDGRIFRLSPDVATTRDGQLNAPYLTVLTRPRPAYSPAGLDLGFLEVGADINERLGYNSNLFADSRDIGTMQQQLTGTIEGHTRWTRGNLNTALGFDELDYPGESGAAAEQRRLNWNFQLAGNYGLGKSKLTAAYRHLSLHQDRASIDGSNFDRPIPFHDDDLQLGYQIPLSRFTVTPGFEAVRLRFDNGTYLGQPLINSTSDRDVFLESLIIRYELQPLRNLVFVARRAQSRFTASGNGTPPANSSDTQILAGIDYDVDGILRARLLGGFEQRSFVSSAYKGRRSPAASAELIWSPSQLTTVTGRVTRTIEDAIDSSAVGVTLTKASLAIDHEYLRNILLGGQLNFEDAKFDQVGSSTRVFGAGASVTWLINRSLQLQGSFDYGRRIAGLETPYARQVIFVNLGVFL